MGDLSKNFDRSEFACNCGCGFDTVDARLIDVLEQIREHFSSPILISSGCRCLAWNSHENGSSESQHTKGRAADIVVSGQKPEDVSNFAEFLLPQSCGIGKYDTFTHIDTRTGCARWGD